MVTVHGWLLHSNHFPHDISMVYWVIARALICGARVVLSGYAWVVSTQLLRSSGRFPGCCDVLCFCQHIDLCTMCASLLKF